MPTILSHAAVPLAIALGLGRTRIPAALAASGVALSILPDLDVVAFRLGIPYGDAFGHRGASHALLTAALAAITIAVSMRSRWATVPIGRAMLFLFAAMASHGLLDMLTNGGHGVAALWPFTEERYFAAVRPIEVSPIGFGFFSQNGVDVLRSEMVWIWLPCAFMAIALRIGVQSFRVSSPKRS